MAALPNVNTVKIKLPNLEKGSSYRSWRMRLRAQMVEQDAWDGVQAALDDPAGGPAGDHVAGRLGGALQGML